MKYKKINFEDTTKFNKNGVDFIGYDAISNDLSFVIETVEEGHFEEFLHEKSTFTYLFLEGSGTFYLDDKKVEVKKEIHMNLYVVRHGETDMGKNRIFATVSEALNETGICQAAKLKSELNDLNIDLVYCSPIDRAKHTLELSEINKNIPVIIDERIKERDMGIYEEVAFDDVDWNIFWGYESDQKYKDLESMKDVYKRVSEFLDEIKKANKDKNILLVTHGGVVRAIDWYCSGVNDSLFTCDNCKVYKFELL